MMFCETINYLKTFNSDTYKTSRENMCIFVFFFLKLFSILKNKGNKNKFKNKEKILYLKNKEENFFF